MAVGEGHKGTYLGGYEDLEELLGNRGSWKIICDKWVYVLLGAFGWLLVDWMVS